MLLASPLSIATPSVQVGFSPEGTAQQLVLSVIGEAQRDIRLMGYTFTLPKVARALIAAHRCGGGAFPLFALLWGYNLASRPVRQAQATRLWLWAVVAQPGYWLVMRHDGLAFTDPDILFLFAAVTQALAVASLPMRKGAPTRCWPAVYCWHCGGRMAPQAAPKVQPVCCCCWPVMGCAFPCRGT